MTNQIQVSYQDNLAFLQIATDEASYLERGFVENLKEAISEINHHQTTKAVILIGGNKNFCLGGSHQALTGTDHLQALPFYVADIPRLILSIEVPTIACMAGHGIGGGLVLGLWCDLVALSESSLYGANFMALGFTPGMGGTFIINQAFGHFLGKQLLFTGRLITGKEIKQSSCPLSSAVFPKKQVKEVCLNWAEEIKTIPLPSLKLLKHNQIKKQKEQLEQTLADEQMMHQTLFNQQEVIDFMQKHYQQSLTA